MRGGSLFGALESVRIDPATSAAFVNFVNPEHAAACLQDKPSVHLQGQRVELAWGKAKPMSEALQMAVQRGATRNLYLGNLPADVEQGEVLRVFSSFGPVESLRLLSQARTGFVNFCTIEAAMAARQAGHGVPVGNVFPRAEPYDGAELPFQVTFTSAAQLCRKRGPGGGGGGGAGGGGMPRNGGMPPGGGGGGEPFVGRVTRVVSGNGRNFCFVAVPSKNVEIYCPLNRLHRNHAFDAVRNGDAIAGSLQPSRVKPGTFEALDWGPAPPGAAEG